MLEEFPETLVNIEWHSAGYTPGDSDFADVITMIVLEPVMVCGVVCME